MGLRIETWCGRAGVHSSKIGSWRECSPTANSPSIALAPRAGSLVRFTIQKLVAQRGFEPPPTGSETGMLPLHHWAVGKWHPLIDLNYHRPASKADMLPYTKGAKWRSRLDLHQQPPPSQSGARRLSFGNKVLEAGVAPALAALSTQCLFFWATRALENGATDRGFTGILRVTSGGIRVSPTVAKAWRTAEDLRP